MKLRLLSAVAIIGLMSTPSWAGCMDDLAKLKSAVVTAETGASTEPTGMDATKHQKEVLSGEKAGTDTETTASTSGEVEAISPHQKEVTGDKNAQPPEQASQLMKDATDMANAGDEVGCMQKLTALKDALGAK